MLIRTSPPCCQLPEPYQPSVRLPGIVLMPHHLEVVHITRHVRQMRWVLSKDWYVVVEIEDRTRWVDGIFPRDLEVIWHWRIVVHEWDGKPIWYWAPLEGLCLLLLLLQGVLHRCSIRRHHWLRLLL